MKTGSYKEKAQSLVELLKKANEDYLKMLSAPTHEPDSDIAHEIEKGIGTPKGTHALTAGILRVREGDPLVFASAWAGAHQAGLLSPDLAETLENLALANNLPPEFIASLKPRRARNPDGAYIADDPNTPDVDEAWAP